jgi:hypothetical protein
MPTKEETKEAPRDTRGDLTSNVLVGGTWYGPAYPDNTLTADVRAQITNEGAFERPEGQDNRFRADDFATEPGATPSLSVSGTVDEAASIES